RRAFLERVRLLDLILQLLLKHIDLALKTGPGRIAVVTETDEEEKSGGNACLNKLRIDGRRWRRRRDVAAAFFGFETEHGQYPFMPLTGVAVYEAWGQGGCPLVPRLHRLPYSCAHLIMYDSSELDEAVLPLVS